MSLLRLVLTGLLSVVCLAACNVIPKPVEVTIYPLPYESTSPANGTQALTIQVSQPRALYTLDNKRISVFLQDGSQAYMQQVRLQDRMPLLVQHHIVRGLRDANVVQSVVSNNDAAAYQFELVSYISQFAVRQGSPSIAEVEVTAHLIRSLNREVVSSRTFHIEHEVEGRGAVNSVSSLGYALNELNAGLRDWIESTLQNESR